MGRHLGYSSRHTQVPVPATTHPLRGEVGGRTAALRGDRDCMPEARERTGCLRQSLEVNNRISYQKLRGVTYESHTFCGRQTIVSEKDEEVFVFVIGRRDTGPI